MRALAWASKILHTDCEYFYKFLGKSPATDGSIPDAAYNGEIEALEPRWLRA